MRRRKWWIKNKFTGRLTKLSPQSLEKVSEFIEFLHFKEKGGSGWAKDFYDLFAPARQHVVDTGMTEDEVDQIIDETLEEVRRGRRP